jgi:hypothetical protein
MRITRVWVQSLILSVLLLFVGIFRDIPCYVVMPGFEWVGGLWSRRGMRVPTYTYSPVMRYCS